MSASALSPTSRSSWRSPMLPRQEYDPTQSFAYTSAYSGAATTVFEASTVSYSLHNGILTRELIQHGLLDLGRTGDGTKIAYLSLTLSGYGLEDISLLSTYPHLQLLNLASNNLTDVSLGPLSGLPYLLHLNVSYNKLAAILDFQPPKNLMEVNYSHNEIEVMCDLSAHHSLQKLNLDCNHITEVSGLVGLRCLSHLSLASNRLEQISNLNHLPLKYLNLSGNSIKLVENLETLTQLQMLDLSGNQISSLRGLGGHSYLTDINMEENEVIDIREVMHLKDLPLLKNLNLSRNPIEALADYRPNVVFHLSSLIVLDNQRVTVEEKVASLNRFAPPPVVVAAHDHRVNITQSIHKPARLRFSTLTRLEEPYPMLVLCGPPGSGKGHFSRLLVEEFPNFFGLGVSHTTRPQRSKESHGRDYYYIDESTFDRATKSGEFLQTFRTRSFSYGLTMAAIEQVAQQGLACVTHMNIEGVLTLKNTHFEPRYILTLPLTPQIHEQRLKAKGYYTEAEIRRALHEVHVYKKLHQEKPGFFDTAINTDSLREGYHQLRALVMAYGDISPESPLSLTSTSQLTTQQTTTSVTTSERTSPQPNTDTQTPSLLLDPSEASQQQLRQHQLTPEAILHMQEVAKVWARPSSSQSAPGGGSQITSVSGIQQRLGSRTPLSDHGGRRHKQIRAAVAGRKSLPYEESTPSGSRPGTSMSKSGGEVGHAVPQQQQKVLEEEEGEDSSEESSDESEHSASASSLSKLSSARGFSPENPATPLSAD